MIKVRTTTMWHKTKYQLYRSFSVCPCKSYIPSNMITVVHYDYRKINQKPVSEEEFVGYFPHKIHGFMFIQIFLIMSGFHFHHLESKNHCSPSQQQAIWETFGREKCQWADKEPCHKMDGALMEIKSEKYAQHL